MGQPITTHLHLEKGEMELWACGLVRQWEGHVHLPKAGPGPTPWDWVCPPNDLIKISMDGSFVEQTGEAGTGGS